MKKKPSVQRYPYDLSNRVFTVGAIGSLQTLASIPIVAGDSVAVDLQAVVRLSALRRTLPADAQIDTFAFFVPHRHIYGSDWTDHMKAGVDSAVSLATYTSSTGGINCVGENIDLDDVVPKYLLAGYARIWNFYFRNPTSNDLLDDDHLVDADTNARTYGVQCAHLPAIWNTGVDDTIASADRQYTVTGGVFDIPDFASQVARLKTEITRDYKGVRYFDLINEIFGSYVTQEMDQRPYLLYHNQSYISGFDVDGTDQASLGFQSGKAISRTGLSFPYKFFAEHGCLWIMAVVRFKPDVATERHYLTHAAPAPSYAQIAGDPDEIMKHEPYAATTAMHFTDGDSTVLNKIPWAQWYREHHPNIHPKFKDVAGHCFMVGAPGTTAKAYYTTHDLYDSVFNSLMMKHWQIQAACKVHAFRVIPPPMRSIYAGTDF